MKAKIIDELRYLYNDIIDEKMKYLILTDKDHDHYNEERLLREKEKADLVEDIIIYVLSLSEDED